MRMLAAALFLTGSLMSTHALAADKAPAREGKPGLHCPLPGDPDGMAKRLGPQGQMYCAELEKFAILLETPGVDTLEAAVRKAFEFGVYNEWTLAAEEALAEFVPAYAKPIHVVPLVESVSLL